MIRVWILLLFGCSRCCSVSYSEFSLVKHLHCKPWRLPRQRVFRVSSQQYNGTTDGQHVHQIGAAEGQVLPLLLRMNETLHVISQEVKARTREGLVDTGSCSREEALFLTWRQHSLQCFQRATNIMFARLKYAIQAEVEAQDAVAIRWVLKRSLQRVLLMRISSGFLSSIHRELPATCNARKSKAVSVT